MRDDTFDSLSRLVARPVSRRRVLITAAVGLVTGSALTDGRARAETGGATELVLRYYENINAYQYEQAYALLGSRWHGQQSLAAFTKGFANTAFVQCETAVKEETNGDTTVVRVRLTSWHNDETIVAFMGAYTVGMEAGQLVILAGDNTLSDPPADIPHLCTVDDLDIAIGRWDAATGSRYASVVGTNIGTETCVVGGSPRVTLTDANQQVLRSTSQEGSPPRGIVLAPGDSAHAPLRFANWCAASSDPGSLTVELPGDPGVGTVDFSDNGISYPPCLGEGQAALLEIKGWVKGAG